jgi:O-antigen ligase
MLTIQAMTMGAVGLWVVRCWLAKSYRLLWPPACWAVALFLIYAVVRYRMVLAEGGVEYIARVELIEVLIYGALFFVMVNNLSRQEATQLTSLTLFGLGTLLSMYAIFQFLTKSKWVLWSPQYEGYIGRGSATFMCPNHLAGFLEMLLPLTLAFTLTGRFKPTAKVFLAYSVLAIFAGIGVTLSRGGWTATGMALLVFFGLLLRRRGHRLTALVFLVLLLGAFGLFFKNLPFLQRRLNVVLNENQLSDARFRLWKPTVHMWQDHFWWGVGPAHFDARFRLYRPDDVQMRPLYAHNDYLNTLADWGLVGMVLIAAALVLLYWGVLQTWKFVRRSNDLAAKQSNRSAFVLGAAVALFAILVHSFVDFNMHLPANAILAITLMALLAGHCRFATERYWFKLSWVGKLTVTGLCLVFLGYLSEQGWRRGREYVLLDRAAKATELQPKLASLKAAYSIDPQNSETTYQLGETLRLASWQGFEGYQQLATEALQWFDKGIKLNQFDPYNYLRYGMCLHWLDRHGEAAHFFEKALSLDPRSYYMLGLMGWHCFQLEKYDEAKRWFEEAVYQAHWAPEYHSHKYETGVFYLDLIKRLNQAGAGQNRQ